MTTETTPTTVTPVVPPVTPVEPVLDKSAGYDDMASAFDDLLIPEAETTVEDDDDPLVLDKKVEPAVEVKVEKAEPAVVVEPVVEPKAAVEVFDEDEKKFLTEYEKEWPDISRGEALKRRAEYRDVVKYIFSEMTRVYGPLIERGSAAADTVAETTALSLVRAVHADYDDAMFEAVNTWAEGLTGTRKRIAEEIIAEGNPNEVSELITEFKSATGRSKPRIVADGGAPSVAPVVTELSAKAKQAAKAIGVVESKRTTPTQPTADVDDFDAGWLEAIGSK